MGSNPKRRRRSAIAPHPAEVDKTGPKSADSKENKEKKKGTNEKEAEERKRKKTKKKI